MVIDIGSIHDHLRPKSTNTLRNMRKTELIEYIRQLEHNYNVAQSFLNQQAKNFERFYAWTPVDCGLPPMQTDVLEDGEYSVEFQISDPVLAYTTEGRMVKARVSVEGGNTYWYGDDCETYEVTHWRPMPNPPEGVKT